MTNSTRHSLIGPDTVITYYGDELDSWARACGREADELHRTTKTAIRERHHSDAIVVEGFHARGRQPDVFSLNIGSLEVLNTVEPHAVVVRGYGWELWHEPLDDLDGGFFYCNYEWSLPPDEQLLHEGKEEP